MLYIATSNRVLAYDPDKKNTKTIITKKHTSGFFSKKARCFFGICHDSQTDRIIVASREKLGTPACEKPTTDTKLHAIDPSSNQYQTIATVKDIHDVHQIACSEDLIFLTDTGKNRIPVYSLATNSVIRILNIGNQRKDINHVNAVTVRDGNLHIGLNNRGKKQSEIISIALDAVIENTRHEIDVLDIAEPMVMSDIYYSHDLEPYNDFFLMCASRDGLLIRSDSGEKISEIGHCTRGIAVSDSEIWVSASQFAKRVKRHSRKLDGYLYRLNKINFEVEEQITIENVGQMNDMVYIKECKQGSRARDKV